MAFQLGIEFREGAADPPLWENEDRNEELLQRHCWRGKVQPSSTTESFEEPSPAPGVFPDNAWAINPAVLDQKNFSTPSQQA